MPTNYSNCVFYKIEHCEKPDLFYIGSTTNFMVRKRQHESACNNTNNILYENTKLYKMMRENGGWDYFEMSIIEEYPCIYKCEMLERFKELKEELKPTMNFIGLSDEEKANRIALNKANKAITGNVIDTTKQKQKEWRELNRDFVNQRQREYYQANKTLVKNISRKYQNNNKDKINMKQKEYYEQNKEKVLEKKKEYYQQNKEEIKKKRIEKYELNKDKINEEKRRQYALKKQEQKQGKINTTP